MISIRIMRTLAPIQKMDQRNLIWTTISFQTLTSSFSLFNWEYLIRFVYLISYKLKGFQRKRTQVLHTNAFK